MYVCVCVLQRSPWLAHMAAICEVPVVERKLRERGRENTWSEGSQKCPVQLAGMFLLCFIDGLMFWKTRGTTVVILWAAMCLCLVVSKQHCVTVEGGKGQLRRECERRLQPGPSSF